MTNETLNIGTRGEIVIYQPPEGGPRLELRLERDTIWMDAHQMAGLFERDRTVIVRHIHNIYGTGELSPEATCAKNAQVAADGKLRQMDLYNLDVVISVGYRVNSRRGTQFRIWATNVLRDHLVRGYSVNERRLRELRLSLRMVEHALEAVPVTADEAAALLRLVTDYAYALDLLDDYDHQRVTPTPTFAAPAIAISYEEALAIIERLRERFGASSLFGLERDQSLHSSLNAIMQTFDGEDVYPSLEMKAAHLLYFLVKNHSFVDGNKRIAAALFLWFMEKNGLLRGPDGVRRIANNTLVAMTLLTAISPPAEKPVIISMIVNLINGRN
jgi:prophage maintenance system killer protein